MDEGHFSSTWRCFRNIISDAEEPSGRNCSTIVPLENSVALNGWSDDAPLEATALDTELDGVCRKMLPCIYCGEAFNDRWSLKLHRQTHVQMNCPEAIQTPNPETNLNGKRCENCPHCEYRSSHSGHLKKHVSAVHIGQKPYKCPHCEYRATLQSSLNIHVTAVHMGQKPHKCPHCEYKSSYSGNLKKHVTAVHMGQKHYKCPQREYRAARSSSLDRHVTAEPMGQFTLLETCMYDSSTHDVSARITSVGLRKAVDQIKRCAVLKHDRHNAYKYQKIA